MNEKFMNLPVFEDGREASKSLPPMSLFQTHSGKICQLDSEPGQHLTRGQFGDTVYAFEACVWDYNEKLDEMGWVTFDPSVHDEKNITWKVWDSDFGLL